MIKSKLLTEDKIQELIKMYPDYTNIELKHHFNVSLPTVYALAKRLKLFKSPTLTRRIQLVRNNALKDKVGEENLVDEAWSKISTGYLIKRVGNVTLHKGV